MKEQSRWEFGPVLKVISKITGLYRINRDSLDFKWGSFSPKFGFRFNYQLGFYDSCNHHLLFNLGWGGFIIKLPFKVKDCSDLSTFEEPEYGFHFYQEMLWLEWGERKKTIWLPFKTLDLDRMDVLGTTSEWIDLKFLSYKEEKELEESGEIYTETHPFTYVLDSGKVQNRKATCQVRRWEWKRKWFPFLDKTRLAVDIMFNSEVGEEAGSYKGGLIGTTRTIDEYYPGVIQDTLEKMEAFERL